MEALTDDLPSFRVKRFCITLPVAMMTQHPEVASTAGSNIWPPARGARCSPIPPRPGLPPDAGASVFVAGGVTGDQYAAGLAAGAPRFPRALAPRPSPLARRPAHVPPPALPATSQQYATHTYRVIQLCNPMWYFLMDFFLSHKCTTFA